MKRIKNLNIIEHEWSEVRDDVFKVDAELAKICDQINPTSDYKLYEANYAYGELILNEGVLSLPTNSGSVVPLDSALVPHDIKNALSYSSAPIGLIMTNTVEVFIESDFDVIPLVILGPGKPLGLLETLDPVGTYCLRHVWSTCSGARSVYMLPKISDKASHSRLQRELGITIDAPKHYFDHFNIFKSIAKSHHFAKNPWSTKLLFFSGKWFESEAFHDYLRRYMHEYSSYARNKSTFDVLWHFFSKELTVKSKRPNPYILDTLKHVVEILIGMAPGYAPIDNDHTRGPLCEIQKIYLDAYRLTSVPTIMAPYHFSVGDPNSLPVVHSMNNPGMFETIPKMKETESLITDLVQASSLFKSFYDLGRSGKLKIRQTILEKAFHQTELLFYHASPGNIYSGIKLSSELPKEDKRFLSNSNADTNSSLKFSDNGEFVKSCILIKNSEV